MPLTNMTGSCHAINERPGLQQLLQKTQIWRGRDHDFHSRQVKETARLATGYALLDQQLPTAGWPRGALTEILSDYPGQGELRLLLPVLRALTNNQQTVTLIDPPWIPYAPALAAAGIALPWLISIGPLQKVDRLWALEQVLRAGHCGVVLAWPEPNLTIKTLRRLQLAAEAGQAAGFLFRASSASQQHSPAVLRIQLKPLSSQQQQLDIIKCRGKHFTRPLILNQNEQQPQPLCQV